MNKFSLAICVEGGTIKGHKFEVGDIYPILGRNNGVHICYMDNDNPDNADPQDLLCHNFEFLAPVDGEQFYNQDGTIPPFFDYYSDDNSWIDVKKEVPPLDEIASVRYSPLGDKSSKRVLVTVEGCTYPNREKKVTLARYIYDKDKHGNPKGWVIANNFYGKVIAWMYLPEPY